MEQSKTTDIPPVAFMIFNRPDYTQQVFNAIRAAKPKKLFVVADGPRTPDEAPLCEATRAIINQVDWDCEVHKNYAEKNLGLKKRISSGLDWFFKSVEAGIILEDDCLPHPSFFRFAGEMLDKYKDDQRIMMITGDNFLPDFKIGDSYFFSRYFPIWGWATWRRSWKKYDVTIPGWTIPGSKKKLKTFYTQSYMVDHMSKLFDSIRSETLNTWDVQWLYACLMSEGFCIMPGVNLISNIGLVGTHSSGSNQNLLTYDIYEKRALEHPRSIIHNTNYDNMFYEKNFQPPKRSALNKMRRKIIEIAVTYKTIKRVYRLWKKLKISIVSKIA